MKGNKGFTLIELIIVIVILGILGALIIPRFAALDTQARNSTVRALEGSMYSAAAIAHALYLADGNSPSTVSMDGRPVDLIHGYPQATEIAGTPPSTTGGIGNTLASTQGFEVLTGTGGTGAGASITYQRTDAPTKSGCQVVYTAPASAGAGPTIVATAACS